jgi:hypothetical protein
VLRSSASTFKRSCALATLALAASHASAGLVDFNGLPAGTILTNQVPGLTFSSEPGQSVVVGGGFLCTGTPGFNCTNDIYIDFATAVTNLSIDAIEANEFGVVATFYLYSGATLLGTQDLIGLGATPGQFGFGNQTASLTGFAGVTRLEIRGPSGTGQLDSAYGGGGIGWDNLRFDASTTSVPEPGTWALVALGLAGAAAARRKPTAGTR